MGALVISQFPLALLPILPRVSYTSCSLLSFMYSISFNLTLILNLLPSFQSWKMAMVELSKEIQNTPLPLSLLDHFGLFDLSRPGGCMEPTGTKVLASLYFWFSTLCSDMVALLYPLVAASWCSFQTWKKL